VAVDGRCGILIMITSARYIKVNDENNIVEAIINGITMCVPINLDNRHYQMVLEWVEEGNTIEEAE